MTSIEDLVRRYVAVWNEPDPARRRQCIARRWAEDGAPEMRPAGGGPVAARGRIRSDDQFAEPVSPA